MSVMKLIILSSSEVNPARFTFAGIDNSFSFTDTSPVTFSFSRG